MFLLSLGILALYPDSIALWYTYYNTFANFNFGIFEGNFTQYTV
jgi:hypothetical protein